MERRIGRLHPRLAVARLLPPRRLAHFLMAGLALIHRALFLLTFLLSLALTNAEPLIIEGRLLQQRRRGPIVLIFGGVVLVLSIIGVCCCCYFCSGCPIKKRVRHTQRALHAQIALPRACYRGTSSLRLTTACHAVCHAA